MNLSSTPLRRSVAAALAIPFVTGPVTVRAALDDAVLLWGKTTAEETMLTASFNGRSARLSMTQACRLASRFVMMNMPATSQLSSMMATMGFETEGGGEPFFGDEVSSCESDGFSGDVWFIYTTCSMIMGSGTHWMRWTVPPFTSEAEMIALDTSTGEGFQVPLQTRLEELNEAVPMAVGELTDLDITGPGTTQPVTLYVPDAREYTAQSYTFSYQGDLGSFAPEGFEFMAQMGTIETTGDAWIAPDAPGADVVGTFYRNFRDHVAPSAGLGSLLGGMIRQMAGLAMRGIPVETSQTTTMSMGAVGLFGNAGAGADSTSTSRIDRIMVLPGIASGDCAPTVVPEDVELTDLGTLMSAAGSGAGATPGAGAAAAGASGAGAAAPGGAELEQALSQMSEALSQMTPEQREMLQSFGLGAAQQAAGSAAAPAAATSAMPPAEELYSDDLTQMAQNHLAALGYDTGNTSGELSTETVIAISQFQAERGLDVTGEVTPQLVGILSAEVDARR